MFRKSKRSFSILMTVLMLLSLFLPYLPAPTAEASEVKVTNAASTERKIRFNYIREDQNFGTWNMWTWNTGVKDGQVDFTKKTGNTASVDIPVSAATAQMGFVLRSTTNWDTAEKEFNDRFIPVNRNDSITKAFITSGVEQIRIVPDGSAPKIDKGNATFFYRDKALFASDSMNSIEKVELKFDGKTTEMTYEPENERFILNYNSIPNGKNEYTFLVTKDGETTEVSDPYNTVDGKSFVDFRIAELSVSGSVTPASIDYNENAVLTVGVDGLTEGLEARSITADVSALGRSKTLKIDPSLRKVTIAVDDNITAGTKTIPVTVVDNYGNEFTGETTVEVKTRQTVGENDFDWDESVIYFMLTDRFFDGDSSNNDPYDMGYDKINDRGTYQGGDFKGITKKLDYLDALGVNTIWISPIVENVKHDVRSGDPAGHSYYGYHGYWASNFGELNPHFGTMGDFHELIDAAHERGIKIMVDVVLNHTGYGLKDIDGNIANPPKGFPTNEDRARFGGLLRQGNNVGEDEIVGELAGLPDLKTEEPAVREAIIKWQTDWIDKATTSKGNTIDYFRVDTVKHVENATWMAFKNALTEKMPEHKMIGETWGASAGNYSGYLDSGMMDSLLDFGFKEIAHDFVNGKLNKANDALISRSKQIDNAATLGQFLGSHDEDGFLHNAGNDKGKLKVAASLQATSKGQPVIYYGEELGQSGANNYPEYDNRYDLAWDNVEGNDVLEHYKKIFNFRADYSEIFAKGERKAVGGSDADKFLMFQRSYKGDSAYVGLNVAKEAKQITLTVDAGATVKDHYADQTYTADDGEVTLSIPGKADGGTVLLTVENGAITAAVSAGKSDGGGDGEVTPVPENHIRIHYNRTDNNYENFGAWLWNDVASPSANWPNGATKFTNKDSYGAYIDVPLREGAKNISFLVMDVTKGDAGKDGGDKAFAISSPEMNEIWIKQGSDKVYNYQPATLAPNTIRIHYVRDNNDYANFGAWLWNDVKSPSAKWPTDATMFDKTDLYGSYIDVELTEDAKNIGFLVMDVTKGDEGKDSGDKGFNLLDRYNEIWIRQGDNTVYISPYWEQATGLVSAEVVSEEKLLLGFTMTEGMTEDALKSSLEIKDSKGDAVPVTAVKITSDKTVEVTAEIDLANIPLTVTYAGRTVSASSGWRMLDSMYAYDGDDLGATYKNGGATLKLWAPKASKVVANIYNKSNAAERIGQVDLSKGDKGVWSVNLTPGTLNVTDFKDYYYQYEVTNDGVTRKVLDPYAKSMAAFTVDTEGKPGPDGDTVGKAAIIDLSDTNPKGFSHAKIDGYEKREDAIIYEVHVRDFTSDPSINGDLNARWGSYTGFIDKLDYIKSLGVTHVQLLPVMAWYYGDETKMGERELHYSAGGNEYNWGYDPHSYFSPDGAYSLDPTNPEQRVKELKELIDAIHGAGMGVVFDVVYTHMAKASMLNDIVPNYYSFQDAQGNFLGGFGNNLATNRTMAEKLMVDSVKYWFDEYKIDGMRFDMMGDATYPSIQNAFDAAAEINPDALFIGEGWRTFAGHLSDPSLAGMGADQDWMDKTDSVGVFSDEIRNELKSGFGSEGEPRFLTGGARDINVIFNNIKGQPSNTKHDDPGDMVQYIEAHDNMTLYDVIAQSIKKDPAIPANNEEIHKRMRVGNSIILTSQGTAFLHAGQEYGRTKQWLDEGVPEQKYHELKDAQGKSFGYFIHDSYDSSDAINMFDWEKATNAEKFPINVTTSNFTQGLIDLRKSTNAFRLGEKGLVDQNVKLLNLPEIKRNDLAIAYENKSTDGTGTYYVFVNADEQNRTFTLGEYDLSQGTVLVDSDEAGVTGVKEASGYVLTDKTLTIDPLTTVVIKVGGKTAPEAPSPEPVPVDTTPPVVEGVKDNTSYNKDVTISFNEGTATLNGAAFANGTVVKAEGTYTLVVTDSAGNTTTVKFTIDKTAPKVEGVSNGSFTNKDLKVTFNEGNATLNGKTFTSGTVIKAEGTYTLVVTDAAGNETTVKFTIDKTAPKVEGVSNGSFTNKDLKVTFNEGNATLNGKAFKSGTVIKAEGTYTLVVTDAAGNKTTVKFTIDKTAPKVNGVTNGALYNRNVAIAFNEGTATLNGKAIKTGTVVKNSGTYTVVATDLAGNKTTVKFTIDKTAPKVSGVSNNAHYNKNVKISFNEGTATLNGKAFKNGTVVKAERAYTLTVTDKAGNKTVVKFTIDKKAPAAPKVKALKSTDKTVSGTAEAHSVITVKAGNKVIGTATTNKNGKYIVTIKAQKKNTTLTVTAKDRAGNVSKAAKVKVK
ncbi:pullulanase [Bacillus lacus]|uniref:pullulanase n=1 Tax=Metabacillus lacus TaxID=1983721 RepID=A0A7X2IWY7_9BACI|nr:pullulanase [Metabacillus lacus]MRX71170.1 pullulanase [Metabacillus lacus]